ncbi:LL-diaminopimelate aminotransferase [Bacillus sp. DTU_2020_1000418_1_SI_GHA_SEK_038]|uniref:LL-diaminopimelate aminotransferase n=1 Tax=Bacillus sp. DTU_2020_1000418_1_SI_GHA_SEK_038 TaxID=3077585 RepID=UPI0028EDF097|nr:LL-diaminopimelate aminotransferase [Bacillus sp. DTU_2020_1000418_1_SI_GHA_SEK_038]WNS73925.1 LL-diaminopimelate aminotransferase [Bacillus sp. DTU_2020_1000418_1_SI_GHA_SEK_038]
MKITMAERMNSFQESIFSELAYYKKLKLSEGQEMVDLSVGSPDTPPPAIVTETIAELAKNPNLYGYSMKGTDDFHKAVCTYYDRRFRVSLDPNLEVSLLMGSQDGLVHFPMVLCNPGDYVLVPDPGYTAYETGVSMAGAKLYPMPLKKENQFLPDFSEIPEEISEKAKLMILNFPGNPVPAMGTQAFFEEAIAYAKKYNIVILHDFAYSELYYEEQPISFLSVDGAMEVGIEMNSLSKSFNMAGCRIAYAAGNREIISMLANFKSNVDYGVFFPIQAAAAKALRDESQFLSDLRAIYKNRRDVLVNGLREIGWNVSEPKASMFVWAEVPSSFTSKDFAIELINRANVVVTPGNAFGSWGEGYVRIALVQSEDMLKRAVSNIKQSGILEAVTN